MASADRLPQHPRHVDARWATSSNWKRCATCSATTMPPLSSTKALTGHSLGAASVHEAIYCLLMMRDGFMAGSANIDTLDPRAEGFPILRETRERSCDTVMSNSFGFGGTNGTLVFRAV